jgi:hypothetical protein
VEVIQRAIDGLSASTYLEIGVSSGDCFKSIRVGAKIGVDPVAPTSQIAAMLSPGAVSYYQMTSDAFFADVAPRALAQGVDVAFIDGLHTDHQSYRDCLNALHYLSPGGVVFMHDNLPATAAEATPASSYAAARDARVASWNGEWTGDSWKAVVRLRALHRDVSARVLHCDHGVAVVWKQPSRRVVACSSEDVDAMTYEDLIRDRRRLLGLCAPARIDGILRVCRQMRRTH